MDDFRIEIPKRAFINAEIIQFAARTIDFQNCVKEVINKYGLSQYEYFNPAYVVSLLYCLIVVPKEMWKLDKNHHLFKQLEKDNIIDYFNVMIKDKEYNKYPVYQLIRHLRNAVSHADFAIDSNMTFIFTDRDLRQKNRPKIFEASITIEKMSFFLSIAGAALANIQKSVSLH